MANAIENSSVILGSRASTSKRWFRYSSSSAGFSAVHSASPFNELDHCQCLKYTDRIYRQSDFAETKRRCKLFPGWLESFIIKVAPPVERSFLYLEELGRRVLCSLPITFKTYFYTRHTPTWYLCVKFQRRVRVVWKRKILFDLGKLIQEVRSLAYLYYLSHRNSTSFQE